jgi:UDP:flavonoid glycosyltransferase YjiC (YdhE family)/glycosyltransferase involved in cell wall biosynthesis
MATIVLFSAGTLGDYLPFFALGQALRQRGHHVRAVVNAAVADHARRSDLETIILPDIERGAEHAQRNAHVWDHWAALEGREQSYVAPDITLDDYLAQAQVLAAACRDADLLLATSIRVLGALAHKLTGVPWLTVSLNPSMFAQPLNAAADPYNAQLAELGNRMLERLGFTGPPPFRNADDLHAEQIILASSPTFSQPLTAGIAPGKSVHQTGFWLYEDPEWATWQPDADLARFVAGPQRPVSLSFSSQPIANPAGILAAHAQAAQMLGIPLLVQSGWAGFSAADLPAEIDPTLVHFAGFLPQDWLFARVGAAVQHGGIGSIARALRQSCPLLIEPFGNDQFYNARRVTELGFGAAMHPHRLTAAGIARVLRDKVLQPAYRKRAGALGATINAEDGLTTACLLIERIVGAGASEPPAVPVAKSLTIPRIIHQTWKTHEVPAEWQAYQASWRQHHPDWEYRFWTDAELRAFIAERYAWFLPIYDGYGEPIMRVDAARYFLLAHFGGIYADLDYECLRPFDPLLAGRDLVLGLEPDAHHKQAQPRSGDLSYLVCNAMMASSPGHPFWEHVFRELIASHKAPEPLGATGPFMLTRAQRSFPGAPIDVLPAALLFPLVALRPWPQLSPAEQQAIAAVAYGLHHWGNSWCHEPIARQRRQFMCSLLVATQPLFQGVLDLNAYRDRDLPLISCLMVTRGRAEFALRAIHCFRIQTYPNRELLIIDDDPDDTLARAIAQLADPHIRHIRLPDTGRSLGDLRNLAVTEAAGAYVAQWDDDDLSDPERLAIQMAAIRTLGATACMLQRQQIWWPDQERIALSIQRPWEGSLLCARERLPRYPALGKGEDTPVTLSVLQRERVALLDAPTLYTYVCHGHNTHTAAHWEQHWQAATARYIGAQYNDMLIVLLLRHRLQSAESLVGRVMAPQFVIAPERLLPPVPIADELPFVSILCPVKNALPHLPRFLSNLEQLSYPPERLRLAFLESDSSDGTYELLREWLPALQQRYADVQVHKLDFAYHSAEVRWEVSAQRRRRAILAQSRNALIDLALAGSDWALWIDVDLSDWPPDSIQRLLAPGKPIVVPNCVVAPGGRPFDLNSFKLKPNAAQLDWTPYLIDGILQPPVGFGRLYLNDLRNHELVELDGIGGAMLLVRADLHRDGLRFPEEPYQHLIETEGLARRARDLGIACYGLPNLEVIHPAR